MVTLRSSLWTAEQRAEVAAENLSRIDWWGAQDKLKGAIPAHIRAENVSDALNDIDVSSEIVHDRQQFYDLRKALQKTSGGNFALIFDGDDYIVEIQGERNLQRMAEAGVEFPGADFHLGAVQDRQAAWAERTSGQGGRRR